MKDSSEELEIRDVFGDIRSTVQRSPTKKAWGQLCELLDKIDDAVLEDELLPYLRDHLSRWPRLKRPTPDRWWRRVARGEHEPRAALAGWRLMWGNMSEDDDDEREDSDFSIFTVLATCAIHPQLRSFLLSDGAEWHHNGGDVARFDAASGKLDALLLSNTSYHGEPYDSAYSPDGRLVAFAPVEEMRHGAVHVWGDHSLLWREDLSRPDEDDEGDEDDLDDSFETVLLAFSHDSARLAYMSTMRGFARIVDSETGALRAEITGIQDAAAIALHPTLDLIAVGDAAGVTLHNAAGPVTHHALPHPAHKLLFSRSGDQLAIAGAQLTVLDAAPAALTPHAAHPLFAGDDTQLWGGSWALAALPGGGFRAAVIDAATDGVCVVDSRSPAPVLLSEPGQLPESIAITHDGAHLLCGHVARVWLWTL